MTVEQAYQKYILKTEKNSTNDNITTDKGRFVLLFNESQNKLIEFFLDRKAEDDIRYIQKIHVPNKNITPKKKQESKYIFELPTNYFGLTNVYGYASSDCCSHEKITLFPVKNENENEILADQFNNPSFLYRESPYTISSNNIYVYVDDFKIDNIVLSYYRYPTQISLIDNNDPESDFDESKKIEFDDKFTDRVISLAAGEFDLNQENQRFQLQKARAIQKA